MSEHAQRIEIDTGDEVNAVTFTPNSEYLVVGGKEGVQVWLVEGGERAATMPVKDGPVWSVAASNDGRYIAAGSLWGDVLVWDADYKQVLAGKISLSTIFDVDFSPDSSRLVSAHGENRTATIWDVTARKRVQTLDHEGPVQVAKYCPDGGRIATATKESVRVWDSDNGHLLVNIKINVQRPWRGLLWFRDYLFVKVKDNKIQRIEASTGSMVSEWPVPYDDLSCIALSQHGRFLAYSFRDSVTFWDTSTHTQLGFIRNHERHSIAFSPDDQLLAIVRQGRKIAIRVSSVIKEPGINIGSAVLDAWKHAQLTNVDTLLSISTSEDATHHPLASRALVRARLRQWDAALVDAEESIKIQSSVIGYVAKYMVHVGKGEIHLASRVYDLAFHVHSDHVLLLLLIKAVVLFMTGEHEDAISRLGDLIALNFLDLTLYVVQAYMNLLLGNLHMEDGDYESAIQSFKHARIILGDCTDQPPLIILLVTGWKFDGLATTIQQRLCEALLSARRMEEASETVLRMVGQVGMTESIKTWILDFMQRCLSTPENNANAALLSTRQSEASHPMMPLLKKWARLRLRNESWKDTLSFATGFVLPKLTVYQTLSEHLETTGHVLSAVACFHQMCSEVGVEIDGERVNWIEAFKSGCCEKLEKYGDVAMNVEQYDEALFQYTTALSLNPITRRDLLAKRSTVSAQKGEWEDAMRDSDRVIELDPSSPLGYERRHAALHCKGDYGNAVVAYETMLLKMSESSNPEIREQHCCYIAPEKTKETIRTTIGDTIRNSPTVLIHTISGRLCNKSEQAAAFELTPTFMRLISSTTTHIDDASITDEVGNFYRYATLSHKWEDNEPLFETVIRIVVYDLEASPTHEKLQMFCKIVREAGFNWAWSDTCCINKANHFVLQEALVSMFSWYERSAMTLIFLRGVDRLAKRGALTRNIWNMRAWTLQEYHASKVVRIYTEDWTPYLGLTIYNHKDAPEIISEMEEATGISAQALKALRPGLDDIREKLRLASTRQTTRVEDSAYSLLGIFSTSLPVTYGEGDQALGRLLSQLLTSSGDTSILAWTGRSGSFNSCLPSRIAVFSRPPTSHIPPAISDIEITTGLRSLNLALATKLYERVSDLTVPSFLGRRMRLPCLTFKLGQLVSDSQSGSVRIFHAQTTALGIVQIKAEEDLSRLGTLCLVHPWIDFLLDRRPVGNVMETVSEEIADDKSSGPSESPTVLGPLDTALIARPKRTARLLARLSHPFGGTHAPPDARLLRPPSTLSPSEKQRRVLEFIARLRQPFGALLLTRTRQNVEEYKRVAAESLITVRVEELTLDILDKVIRGVQMLDVL